MFHKTNQRNLQHEKQRQTRGLSFKSSPPTRPIVSVCLTIQLFLLGYEYYYAAVEIMNDPHVFVLFCLLFIITFSFQLQLVQEIVTLRCHPLIFIAHMVQRWRFSAFLARRFASNFANARYRTFELSSRGKESLAGLEPKKSTSSVVATRPTIC